MRDAVVERFGAGCCATGWSTAPRWPGGVRHPRRSGLARAAAVAARRRADGRLARRAGRRSSRRRARRWSRCRCCSSPAWTAASTRRSRWSPTRRSGIGARRLAGHQALDERAARQLSQQEKAQRATYVVVNDGSVPSSKPSCRRSLRSCAVSPSTAAATRRSWPASRAAPARRAAPHDGADAGAAPALVARACRAGGRGRGRRCCRWPARPSTSSACRCATRT